jgi:hypothetical protein
MPKDFDEVAAALPAPNEYSSYFVRFKDNVHLPYVDQVELYFQENNSPGWKAFAERVPGATFRRAFPKIPLAKLKHFLRAPVPADIKYKPHSLLQYHILDVPPGTDPGLVLEALRAWPDVDLTEPVLRTAEPAGVTPVFPDDDPLYLKQKYLQRAPLGVNAAWAWRVPGGSGAGQTVLDLECGWVLDHIDLLTTASDPRAEHIYGENMASGAAHGTAVLGILCANDNATLTVGIAPHTPRIYLLSHSGDSGTIPEAIVFGLLKLAPGDLTLLPPGIVLLIETELRDSANRRWPVEHTEAIRETLFYTNYWGVTVILAAGNGGQDLDTYVNSNNEEIYKVGGHGFLNTGTLYVGAAVYAPKLDPDNPWTRHGDSNYGSRINCFAMGEDVYTLYSTGGNRDKDWTGQFRQTSAAAAIVAGAALCCQGMAQDNTAFGRALKPAELRDLFSTTKLSTIPGIRPNTATADPLRGGVGGIGVMPNLRYIGRQYLGTAEPPWSPQDLRII